jgi:hypothetical protein
MPTTGIHTDFNGPLSGRGVRTVTYMFKNIGWIGCMGQESINVQESSIEITIWWIGLRR